MTTLTEFYGAPIHVYTVADAVRDGVMIVAGAKTVHEAGYRIPVVLTAAAHAELIRWEREAWAQSEDARLWDVLTVMRAAAKQAAARPGDRFGTYVMRVPNRTKSGNLSTASTPARARFDVIAQAFNAHGDACLTILLPHED